MATHSTRRNSRMPPQLEKNHVVPTSWQDEALTRDGVSREVPCSALKGNLESSLRFIQPSISHDVLCI